MPHIQIRDVSLTYDTPAGRVAGVDGVSFDIEQSEFVCLVGPSGCGKSTLLNIDRRLPHAERGRDPHRRQAVTGHGMDRGIVFQDFAQLFPWRTALGNVSFGLEMKGVAKAEREEIARRQLQLVKLEKFANSYPHHLSGGMQQRVAIARALAYNPAVLLMDEPFAALDALTRDDMQRLLADVWRETKKTVVYVTHNVAEAVYLADRVIVMTPASGHAEEPWCRSRCRGRATRSASSSWSTRSSSCVISDRRPAAKIELQLGPSRPQKELARKPRSANMEEESDDAACTTDATAVSGRDRRGRARRRPRRRPAARARDRSARATRPTSGACRPTT